MILKVLVKVDSFTRFYDLHIFENKNGNLFRKFRTFDKSTFSLCNISKSKQHDVFNFLQM